MNHEFFVSRRKFGQILIFSALTTIAGEALQETVVDAKQNKVASSIYGITTIPGTNNLSLLSLNVKTGKTTIVLSLIPGITLNSNERVTSFSRISRQLFLIAIAPTIASLNTNKPRLVLFSPEKQAATIKPSTLALPDLEASDSIESAINPQGNELLLLVRTMGPSRHRLQPQLRSYRIATKRAIDQTLVNAFVPSLQVLCFDPKTQQIYGTSVNGTTHHGGATSLWQGNLQTRNLQKLTDLSLNREPWGSGFRSLVCTEAGDLYGLSAADRSNFNAVYALNRRTGQMKYVSRFDVMNIAV